MSSPLYRQIRMDSAMLPPLTFVWLEITGKCNLRCTHCYAESLPTGTHGTLTNPDWKQVITQAKEIGAQTVQFIGGEPTLHPHFAELVRFAAVQGLAIEVFTNLVRVPPWMWSLFEECSVSLATSFYSLHPNVHDRVTAHKGSQARSLANITEAIARSLPLRVGMIKVFPEQDVSATEEMLRSLGVVEIGIDNVRGVGRGVQHNAPERPIEALCGHCWSSKAAVDPEGWVYPCVFSRWLKIGNVHNQGLGEIITSHAMQQVREELKAEFFPQEYAGYSETGTSDTCPPQACHPMCTPRGGCDPNCPPTCSPACQPQRSCAPNSCWPQYGPPQCRPDAR